MKKIILAAVFFLFSFLSYAQDYPFSVTKSGTGKQTLIFIPGFASSGDVWKETVGDLKNEYTSHVFTMAGFGTVVTGTLTGGMLTVDDRQIPNI